MKLTFVGAAHEVTGSCHFLQVAGKNILVDCGMEQGPDLYENPGLPISATDVDYVFFTHAHIDHSGMLPKLAKDGFKGQIFTTYATADLCNIMLRDSAHIQEFEAEWRNRKGRRAGKPEYEPVYEMQDALNAIELLVPCQYGERITICEGIQIRFTDVGHLLGSASIEVWATEDGVTKKIVFSGDIGNLDQPIIKDPAYTESADYIVMESTYGNRLHTQEKPDYLGDFTRILKETFDKGGNVVIPSFAVGRTQELLYFIREIKEKELLKEAKRIEFPDNVISRLTGVCQDEIKAMRHANNIRAAYKMVDTCAAEFAAETPYYYSCFGSFNEAEKTEGRKKVLVLGSGPIRIGQGIEFDFCSVHSTWAFSKEGYETIIINNNPETVSTDFDIADKLYFEPLTPEDVESIVDIEKPDGAVVQFGGQTAIKLTEALMKMGVPILGTAAEDVDAAEDRERFDEILEQCHIPRPAGHTVFTAEEAKKAANDLGYPVLVRPSYVLGGQGMQIAICDEDIDEFIGIINQIAQEHPILVDKYIMGKEIEVDAICDGTDILIPGIMQHIERTGIHSGDSISVYPAQDITQHNVDTIVEYTEKLAKALHVKGMINIQFIVDGDDVYIIEVNPRSSRTVPYISKVTGIPIVPLATQIICGHTIKELGYNPGLQPAADYIAVKMPVFSFEKIRGADISLGPEMKSTGECLGIAETFNEALYKAFIGAGIRLPKHKNMIITVKDEDKQDIIPIARRFEALGYRIYATLGTAKVLKENGIKVIRTNKLEQPAPNLMDLILGHKIDVVIDTPPQGVEHQKDGFVIRRNAIETGVNVLTSLDTAEALATSLENTDLNNLSLIDIATIARR